MILLTNESHRKDKKICYISRKEFKEEHTNDEKYRKARSHCYYTCE